MLPSLYEIPVIALGRLYIMPKPSGDWLKEDLEKLKGLGVEKLVSMLTCDEMIELGLQAEAEICRQLDIEFTNLSVPDRSVPDLRIIEELVREIQQNLVAGQGVAIHCRAGIGRSGLVASCVLIAQGVDAENSIATVSDARGVRTPDTQEQAEFIRNFRPSTAMS